MADQRQYTVAIPTGGYTTSGSSGRSYTTSGQHSQGYTVGIPLNRYTTSASHPAVAPSNHFVGRYTANPNVSRAGGSLLGNLFGQTSDLISGIPTAAATVGSATWHDLQGKSKDPYLQHWGNLLHPIAYTEHYLHDPTTFGGRVIEPQVKAVSADVHALRRGDWHYFQQHPLNPVLDVATAASLGGSAALTAGRAGLLGERAGELANTERLLKAGDHTEALNQARTLQGRIRQRAYDNWSMGKGADNPVFGVHARMKRILDRQVNTEMIRAHLPLRVFQQATRGLTPAETFAFHVGVEGVPLDERIAFYKAKEQEIIATLGKRAARRAKRVAPPKFTRIPARVRPIRDYLNNLESPAVRDVLTNPRQEFIDALDKGAQVEGEAGRSLVESGALHPSTRAERALLPQRVMEPPPPAPGTLGGPALTPGLPPAPLAPLPSMGGATAEAAARTEPLREPVPAAPEPVVGRQLGEEPPRGAPLPIPHEGPVTFLMNLPKAHYYKAEQRGLDVGTVTAKRGDRVTVRLTEEQLKTLYADAKVKGAGPSGAALRRSIDRQRNVMHEAMDKSVQKLPFKRSADGSYTVEGTDYHISYGAEGRLIAHTSEGVLGEFRTVAEAKRSIERSIAYQRREAANAAATSDPFLAAVEGDRPMAYARPPGETAVDPKVEALRGEIEDLRTRVLAAKRSVADRSARSGGPAERKLAKLKGELASKEMRLEAMTKKQGVYAEPGPIAFETGAKLEWRKYSERDPNSTDRLERGARRAGVDRPGQTAEWNGIPITIEKVPSGYKLFFGKKLSYHKTVTEAKAHVDELIAKEEAARTVPPPPVAPPEAAAAQERRTVPPPAPPGGTAHDVEPFAGSLNYELPPRSAAEAAAVGPNRVNPLFPAPYRFAHVRQGVTPGQFMSPKTESALSLNAPLKQLRHNAAQLLTQALIITDPERVISRDFLSTMRHQMIGKMQEKLDKIATEPEARLKATGFKRPQDWYYRPSHGRQSTAPIDPELRLEQGLTQDRAILSDEPHGAALERASRGIVSKDPRDLGLDEHDLRNLEAFKKAGIKVIHSAYGKDFRAEFSGTHYAIRAFYDRPLSVWRAITLNFRPAWLVNNFVGNGLMGLATYGPAGAAAYLRVLLATEHGERKVLRLWKYTMSVPTLRRKYGNVFSDVVPEIHSAGQFGTQTKIEHLGYHEGKLANFAANPAVRALGFAPKKVGRGILAVGRGITKAEVLLAEDTGREAAFIREAGGDIARVRAVAKKAGEGNLSLAEALRRLDRPSVERAVTRINDVLGDFNDLSHTERAVLRRLIPFYSWYKVIVKVSAKYAARYPARLLLMKNIADAQNRNGEPSLPSWLQGALLIGGASRAGNQALVSTQGLNPYETLNQLPANPWSAVSPAFTSLVAAAGGVDPTFGPGRGYYGPGDKTSGPLGYPERFFGSFGEGLAPTRLYGQTTRPYTGKLYAPHTYGHVGPVSVNDFLLQYLGIPLRHVNLAEARRERGLRR